MHKTKIPDFIRSDKHRFEYGARLVSACDEGFDRKIINFNSRIHGEKVGELTRKLMFHPNLCPGHIIALELNGEIIGSFTIIPRKWNFSGVDIDALELGIFGVDENFRGKGVGQNMLSIFHSAAKHAHVDICAIQGIPYYYTTHGYEYAVPLENDFALGSISFSDTSVSTRKASFDDIHLLEKFYNSSSSNLALFNRRSRAEWIFLIENSGMAETGAERFIIEKAGDARGYVAIANGGFGNSLIVSELSDMEENETLHALGFASEFSARRNLDGLRLNLPENCNATVTAKKYGARKRGEYAWQIFIPDTENFIRRIAPVLETRIRNSGRNGFTGNFSMRIYGGKDICVKFENGKVIEILSGRHDDADIAIPGKLLPKLLLGYRSLNEIRFSNFSAYEKESFAGTEEKSLTDVLFPKTEGFIYSNY